MCVCVCVCVCLCTHMPAPFCVCLPSASQAKSSLVQLPPSTGHRAAVERLLQMNRVKISLVIPPKEHEGRMNGGAQIF